MITQLSQSSVSPSPSSAPPAAKLDDAPDAPSSVASASPSVVVTLSLDGRMAALNDVDSQANVGVAGDNCVRDIASIQRAQEPPAQPNAEQAGNLNAALRQLSDHGKQVLGHVNALGYKVADRASELTEEVKSSPEFASLRAQASELVTHAKALKQEVVEQVKELKESQEFQKLREQAKEVKDNVRNIIKKFRW